MKNLIPIYIIVLLTFFSCARGIVTLPLGTNQEIYKEFWTYVNEHYIYFETKKVDWDAVFEKYYHNLKTGSEQELYEAMESSLIELKDSHNRLQVDGKDADKFDFRDGWEIHFSNQLVEEQYLIDTFQIDGYIHWGYLPENIGYIYLPAFNRYGGMQNILKDMNDKGVQKIIFDMRNNGGGDSNQIPKLAGHFVQEKTILGSYVEKNGPKQDDITAPIPIYAIPSTEFILDIPIVVLINRGSYSATSYFAAMMKGLPNVSVIGQRTGGGGGGNYGYQLSNGWMIAVSVSDFLDKQNNSIEPGVEPNLEIINSMQNIMNRRDVMLEKAIEMK